MLWGCAGADALAGMMGVVAVMCALEWRRKSGRGQSIDLSQVEAVSTFLGAPAIDYSWNGRLWPRRGNGDPLMAPHGCYPAQGDDEWIVVAVEDDEQWLALCRVMERADWRDRADLRTAAGRAAADEELAAGIAGWTAPRDRHRSAHALQAAGVAAAPLLGGADFLEDPHLAARNFVEYVERQWVGTQAHTAMWAKFSGTPGTIRMPAPTLGEHNDQILGGLLGMSKEQIDALYTDRIIGRETTAMKDLG